MRVRFLVLPLLLALGVCGCATIQDYHYNLVQRCRADLAYTGTNGLWSHCSHDYHDGWKQGYFDLSTGQCDEPPATPPHKYWHPHYQSLEGRAAIQDWYSGWQDGATAAIQDGRPEFHPVVASPTAQPSQYNPHAFHCGAAGPVAPELMPPAMPTHEPQPQVHVGTAPQRFASHSLSDDGELLDETALPSGPAGAQYAVPEAAEGDEAYFSGYEAASEEVYVPGDEAAEDESGAANYE